MRTSFSGDPQTQCQSRFKYFGSQQCTGILRLAFIVLLTTSCAGKGNPTQAGIPSEKKHRGVNWVATGPVTQADFHHLARKHISWIIQTPFGWQRSATSPEISLITSGRVQWGETDQGIAQTADLARRHGIKTMLKPHIWLRGGQPRALIAMESEDDWRRWMVSYERFILHYARLSEETGIEALCIGTELRSTIQQREPDWRKIIAAIRGVYHGKLVYAANWYKEYEEVPFWDTLDYIGIQAYFPLSAEESPSVEELKAGWEPYLKAIERLHERTGKPVLFTEIGYRSTADAAIEPWKWPEFQSRAGDQTGPQTQANCYEAFFQTFWQKEWFAGASFWKWYPKIHEGDRIVVGGFTPQNKPAEEVLTRWYAKSLE